MTRKIFEDIRLMSGIMSVSYTHLDVYKRQDYTNNKQKCKERMKWTLYSIPKPHIMKWALK